MSITCTLWSNSTLSLQFILLYGNILNQCLAAISSEKLFNNF